MPVFYWLGVRSCLVGGVRLAGIFFVWLLVLLAFGLGALFQLFTESLILAQDERWRRA